MPMAIPPVLSRRLLLGSLATAAGSTLLHGGAMAAPVHKVAAVDLTGVTLRIGVFRGQEQTMLSGTDLLRTPYRIDFSEFNAGNLMTQAINADALDIGTWSEIPLVFAAASGARVRVVAVMEGPTSGQAVLVPKGSPARSIADLKGKRVGYIRATIAH